MDIKPYGDSAILIEFDQEINPYVHQEVLLIKQKLKAANLSSITFYIPAYCSLTIGYDPFQIRFSELVKVIRQLQNQPSTESLTNKNRTLNIPVCYEMPYALDIKSVARNANISTDDVITLHTSTLYNVYMLGFLPGFAYMSTIPDTLFTKRKATPALSIPAQSVGLAGYQTGIYPSAAPGGWRIIGRTPIPVFDAKKSDPFLFRVGDQVQFQAISALEFQHIENDIHNNVFNLNSLITND